MSFVRFDQMETTGVTKKWAVVPVRGGTILGEVKWYSPWRRYCFFPTEGTLFDTSCMLEIYEFLRDEMAKR